MSPATGEARTILLTIPEVQRTIEFQSEDGEVVQLPSGVILTIPPGVVDAQGNAVPVTLNVVGLQPGYDDLQPGPR